MSNHRREKLSDRIKELLAKELATFRDPRLRFITVTDVKVTGDLKLARIYWAAPANGLELPDSVADRGILPDRAQIDETTRALRGAIGALRRCLATELTLRLVPQIEFLYDESAVYGARIDDLLSKISG